MGGERRREERVGMGEEGRRGEKMNHFQTWLYLIPSYHQKGIKC